MNEDQTIGLGLSGAKDLIFFFAKPLGFPETPQEPEVVVGRIILGALLVIAIVFAVLVVYAGYLWMTARGNEETITKAINTLKNAAIGFILAVGAYAITAYIVTKVIEAAFSPT